MNSERQYFTLKCSLSYADSLEGQEYREQRFWRLSSRERMNINISDIWWFHCSYWAPASKSRADSQIPLKYSGEPFKYTFMQSRGQTHFCVLSSAVTQSTKCSQCNWIHSSYNGERIEVSEKKCQNWPQSPSLTRVLNGCFFSQMQKWKRKWLSSFISLAQPGEKANKAVLSLEFLFLCQTATIFSLLLIASFRPHSLSLRIGWFISLNRFHR